MTMTIDVDNSNDRNSAAGTSMVAILATHRMMIQEVRSKLVNKPKSAKLLARLSSLLIELQQHQCKEHHLSSSHRQRTTTAKSDNGNDQNKNGIDQQPQENDCGSSDIEDAIRFANLAIQYAPSKPHGYMALSLALSTPTPSTISDKVTICHHDNNEKQRRRRHQQSVDALMEATKMLLDFSYHRRRRDHQCNNICQSHKKDNTEYGINGENNDDTIGASTTNSNNKIKSSSSSSSQSLSLSSTEQLQLIVSLIGMWIKHHLKRRQRQQQQEQHGSTSTTSSSNNNKTSTAANAVELTDDELLLYNDCIKPLLHEAWYVISTDVDYRTNSNNHDCNITDNGQDQGNVQVRQQLKQQQQQQQEERPNQIQKLIMLLRQLSDHEYTLGRFFRKRRPLHINQPKSKYHLQMAVMGYNRQQQQQHEQQQQNLCMVDNNSDDEDHLEELEQRLRIANFWLATLGNIDVVDCGRGNDKSLMQCCDMDHYQDSSTDTKSSTNITNIDGKNNMNHDNVVVGAAAISVDKCPAEYIVELYADFAPRFDELLVKKLKYETPTKLRNLLDTILMKKRFDTSTNPTITKKLEQDKNSSSIPTNFVVETTTHISLLTNAGSDSRKFRHLLDLGCGTGLSGLAFSNLVDQENIGTMTGIDLSPHMIEHAKARGCYDNLIVGDVLTALTTTKVPYDLITACDVMCYIGDLREIFRNVAEHALSKQNGYFCFSVESLSSKQPQASTCGGSPIDYCLHDCARFAHSEQYIRQLANQFRMTIWGIEHTVIRKNGGENVMGILVVLSQ